MTGNPATWHHATVFRLCRMFSFRPLRSFKQNSGFPLDSGELIPDSHPSKCWRSQEGFWNLWAPPSVNGSCRPSSHHQWWFLTWKLAHPGCWLTHECDVSLSAPLWPPWRNYKCRTTSGHQNMHVTWPTVDSSVSCDILTRDNYCSHMSPTYDQSLYFGEVCQWKNLYINKGKMMHTLTPLDAMDNVSMYSINTQLFKWKFYNPFAHFKLFYYKLRNLAQSQVINLHIPTPWKYFYYLLSLL